jgi:hypothetical protein
MNQIALTIAQQIGHQAFILMGTRYTIAEDNALLFDVRGSRKCNKISVTLTSMDLYDVTFFKVGRGPKFTITSHTVKGVYFDQLREVIEENTELYLSLGTTKRR